MYETAEKKERVILVGVSLATCKKKPSVALEV